MVAPNVAALRVRFEAMLRTPTSISRARDRVLSLTVGILWVCAIGIVVIDAFVVAPIYNLTGSVPIGLYAEWKLPAAKASLRHAQYIIFCPTPQMEATISGMHVALATDRIHGNCRNGRISFIKLIAALPGDLVDVIPGRYGYVAINGRRWPHSAPAISSKLAADNRLRRPLHERVPAGELWALGITPNSVDSRYFGPLPIAAVEGVATPIAVEAAATSRIGLNEAASARARTHSPHHPVTKG
jgi:type IV secretory pathway protease TraF